jgi:hypothetical protein
MDTLIQRLEITSEELEDKNLKPMAATVREAIKALSDNSSQRQVDAGVRKPLSRYPQKTRSKHAWYYEENYGIDVIHEVYGLDGRYIQTEHIAIPFRTLKQSIDRIEKHRAVT